MSLSVSVSDPPPCPPPGPPVRLSKWLSGLEGAVVSELIKNKNSEHARPTCYVDRDPWREIL